MIPFTETDIAARLQAAYQAGVIASTDGYAEVLYTTGRQHIASLRCAAVLMPLLWSGNDWHLLFTHRTETVEHHKRQVSFPGGGCDEGESTPEQTALREAEEEIGLNPEHVRLLGRLNEMLTITHYRVTPIVGVIPWPYDFSLSPLEVERVFTIPLLWLARRGNWDENPFTPEGAVRPFPVITYHPYDGETLWGASARMVQNFLGVLGLLNV